MGQIVRRVDDYPNGANDGMDKGRIAR